MNILLPTDANFVEQVAKAIGREKMYRDAVDLVEKSIGIRLPDTPDLDRRFDTEFEFLWNSPNEDCVWNKESCIADAVSAINKINLLLLTMPA